MCTHVGRFFGNFDGSDTNWGLVLAVTINLAFGRSDGGKISLMILGNRKLSLKTR